MQRPVGVTILAALNYLVGVYLVLYLGSALSGFGTAGMYVVSLCVPAMILSLGYGLWKLRNWARQIQIVLNMMGAVGCLLLTIRAYSVLRDGFDGVVLILCFGLTVLNVVIILYLLRPQVKQAFGASSHSGGDPEVQKVSEP